MIIAIGKAYDSAGILNRDISVRNIMLTADGRGILNDWDHALWIDAAPTDRIVSISSSRFNQPTAADTLS